MTADDRSYSARLGEVLRQRSVTALRAFLEAEAGRYGDEHQIEAIRAQSDAELEHVRHRMTLARADLADLHAESERWLTGQAPSGARPVPGPPGRAPRRPARPRRRPPAAQ
jgi:hypothetical protein